MRAPAWTFWFWMRTYFTPMVSKEPVEGGPARVRSDRYQIDAKAETKTTQAMMRGPMLRTLLEERFKLKVRRETREVPAYALTVAKGGPKLRPFQEGSCFTAEELQGGPPTEGQKFCRLPGPGAVTGMSMDSLCTWLFAITDRPVINQTGIAGRFDFPLEYAPDDTTPGMLRRFQMARERQGGIADDGAAADPAGRPSLLPALQQQFGLKLEPIKGPRDFVVIEHVERPAEN
jgi:uncharacterized protein (TIGR03435 family)